MDILAFILVASVLTTHTPKHEKIDHDLEFYVDMVYELTDGTLGGKIERMGFDKELDNKILGTCYHLTDEISIHPENWKSLSEKERILLVAHEIAHCECKQEHVESKSEKSWCPEHFMAPTAGGAYCSRIHFDKYIKQMKKVDCE